MPQYVQAILEETSEVLAERVLVADNPWLRLRGLMFKPQLEPGEGLLLSPCNSVHSCFMRFEFDAIFLDKHNQVIHVIEAMQPWRFSSLIWRAKKVLELEAGKSKSLRNQENLKVLLINLNG